MKREFHKILAMMLALIISLAIVPADSVEAASDTVYKGVDYSAVYNYEFYMGHTDLMKTFGKYNDREGAFNHFITCGMKEGRQASPNFNVHYYKANYTDLQKAFGNNLPAYYKHYINYGIKEGRNATSLVRYKSRINVGGVAGELTINQASTVSVSYARNTTTSLSFNGWAQLVNGISNITYDIKHKQTGTTYIIGNQATVYGVKNAQERSYQVECIQIKHLKNGENVINVFATDKNGKKEAIGCINVSVYDKEEWINPRAAGNGARAIVFTNSNTGKASKPISTVEEYMKLINAKDGEKIFRIVEFNIYLTAFCGAKIYNTFPEYLKAYPKKDKKTALIDFLKSQGVNDTAIASLRNITKADIEKAIENKNAQNVQGGLGWLGDVAGKAGCDDLSNGFKRASTGFDLFMLINATEATEAMKHLLSFSEKATSVLPIEGQFVAADVECLNKLIDMCIPYAAKVEAKRIETNEDYMNAQTNVDRIGYLLGIYNQLDKYEKSGCAYLIQRCLEEIKKGNMIQAPLL